MQPNEQPLPEDVKDRAERYIEDIRGVVLDELGSHDDLEREKVLARLAKLADGTRKNLNRKGGLNLSEDEWKSILFFALDGIKASVLWKLGLADPDEQQKILMDLAEATGAVRKRLRQKGGIASGRIVLAGSLLLTGIGIGAGGKHLADKDKKPKVVYVERGVGRQGRANDTYEKRQDDLQESRKEVSRRIQIGGNGNDAVTVSMSYSDLHRNVPEWMKESARNNLKLLGFSEEVISKMEAGDLDDEDVKAVLRKYNVDMNRLEGQKSTEEGYDGNSEEVEVDSEDIESDLKTLHFDRNSSEESREAAKERLIAAGIEEKHLDAIGEVLQLANGEEANSELAKNYFKAKEILSTYGIDLKTLIYNFHN